jgi:ATP-binding cassette subfamily F protein 3
MLRLDRLTLARGANRLLEDASLALHAGQKVGIVGANGCGKSSLFALLRGELLPEAGDVLLPPRWTIAHVAQETPAVATPAIEYVIDGDRELRAVERALAQAELDHAADGHAIAELHHRLEAIDGYAARSRAATLLAGLGFAAARQSDPVAGFSGGWRMRLNLAQALMARSDLLLLDEPTNHLDLDAVLWLEDWLARYPGTLLLVTHDRDFLDHVVDGIVHFDGGRLKSYAGNYSAFERERAGALAVQQAAYEKQQRHIAHLKAFVDRFRAKATKAKQAQSRLKTLERMEQIAAAHVDSPFEFTFAPARTAARQLVRLEQATLGYGAAAPVFERLDVGLLAGERIGLLGRNGAGKSTLAKALAGTLPLAAGARYVAQNLAIGYFAQHQLEQLDPQATPLVHLARLDPGAREQELRDFLGGFDFRGDMVTAEVGRFSGGEKARLVLAMIVRAKPQLLILDEPTNHLDIEMREALAEALQDFDGALVVVAHDRHLLTATTDAFWLVHGGRVAPFDGDLDDYRTWALASARPSSKAGSDSTFPPHSRVEPPRGGKLGSDPHFPRPRGDSRSSSEELESDPNFAKRESDPNSGSRQAQKRAEAEARQARHARRKPHAARLARLDEEIAQLAGEKAAADAWLASADAYADGNRDRLRETVARQGELGRHLALLETQWLEVAEALERIDAGAAPD